MKKWRVERKTSKDFYNNNKINQSIDYSFINPVDISLFMHIDRLC